MLNYYNYKVTVKFASSDTEPKIELLMQKLPLFLRTHCSHKHFTLKHNLNGDEFTFYTPLNNIMTSHDYVYTDKESITIAMTTRRNSYKFIEEIYYIMLSGVKGYLGTYQDNWLDDLDAKDITREVYNSRLRKINSLSLTIDDLIKTVLTQPIETMPEFKIIGV